MDMYKSICPLFYYRLSYNIKLVIVIIFKLYSLDNLNNYAILRSKTYLLSDDKSDLNI